MARKHPVTDISPEDYLDVRGNPVRKGDTIAVAFAQRSSGDLRIGVVEGFTFENTARSTWGRHPITQQYETIRPPEDKNPQIAVRWLQGGYVEAGIVTKIYADLKRYIVIEKA